MYILSVCRPPQINDQPYVTTLRRLPPSRSGNMFVLTLTANSQIVEFVLEAGNNRQEGRFVRDTELKRMEARNTVNAPFTKVMMFRFR